MKKLLAIDMDGTCLTDKKRITEKTMSALKKAAEKGIIIVPTTGRSLDSFPGQLIGADFYRYAITSNGARVYDVKDKKTIYSSLIPMRDAITLLLEGRKHGLGLTAHVENQNIIEGFSLNLKGRLIYKKDIEDTIKTKDIIQTIKELNGDVEEVQFFFFNEKKNWWTKDIVAKNPNYTASFGRIYVEMYNKNTSKGVALAKLAEVLGIEKNDIVCIGNGENDLTMFDESGFKIAVGNADLCLKEKADLIVETNNKDGVAEAVEKIFALN